MDFKVLQETQPKFIKLIAKSYQKKRLSQVYLLDGVRGTPKIQGALYLAHLLFCETHNHCGVCSNCKLLAEDIHPNLFKIEATRGENTVSNGTIKKEQIEELEKEFSLTSDKTRVLIINEIDKATLSASNTLLKFLEEMKENCYAILICDNLSAVISTIKSRSQIVTFEKINKKVLEEFYLSKSIDYEMARILCMLTNDVMEGIELSKDVIVTQIVTLIRKINKAFFTEESPILVMNDDGKFLLSCNDKKYHQIFLDLLLAITNSRLFYLLGKKDEMIFKETIIQMDELGCDIHSIGYQKTFKQINTMLEFKQRLLSNVNLELMYMDLFIKCEG